jgi:hypothetical protein
MQELLKERQSILDAYAEAPTAQDVQKAKRLKAIGDESIELEAAWFSGHDRLEILAGEMKTAKDAHG